MLLEVQDMTTLRCDGQRYSM
uniref:Uncharacterized protein n=1 Tax=Anguilla anguilla TaxID=7936 RepID=A0A0E9UBE1_ANGAN